MTAHVSQSVPTRDLTVLVVDDDPDLLMLCATLLRSAGFAVLMAFGSVEAQVDHARNLTPRVHGDNFVPILRIKRPRSRILLMSAVSLWTLGGRGISGMVRPYIREGSLSGTGARLS